MAALSTYRRAVCLPGRCDSRKWFLSEDSVVVSRSLAPTYDKVPKNSGRRELTRIAWP